jgi:hypothetical protein
MSYAEEQLCACLIVRRISMADTSASTRVGLYVGLQRGLRMLRSAYRMVRGNTNRWVDCTPVAESDTTMTCTTLRLHCNGNEF